MRADARWNRALRRFAIWKQKAQGTATWKSNKRLKKEQSRGRGFLLRRAEFRRQVATTWRATRLNWRCRKACRLLTGPWKHERPRGSNWIMEQTGSRCT